MRIAPATLYSPFATMPLCRSGGPTSKGWPPDQAISIDSALMSAATPAAARATARRAIPGQPSRDPHHQKNASSARAAAIQSDHPIRQGSRCSAT